MNRATVVRYRVRPGAVEENVRLVRAVYDELAASRPDGLRYSTYRVDDRTFVHVALVAGMDNPLDSVAAFRAFTAGVEGRCEEGPVALSGDVVGSYSPD